MGFCKKIIINFYVDPFHSVFSVEKKCMTCILHSRSAKDEILVIE